MVLAMGAIWFQKSDLHLTYHYYLQNDDLPTSWLINHQEHYIGKQGQLKVKCNSESDTKLASLCVLALFVYEVHQTHRS